MCLFIFFRFCCIWKTSVPKVKIFKFSILFNLSFCSVFRLAYTKMGLNHHPTTRNSNLCPFSFISSSFCQQPCNRQHSYTSYITLVVKLMGFGARSFIPKLCLGTAEEKWKGACHNFSEKGVRNQLRLSLFYCLPF